MNKKSLIIILIIILVAGIIATFFISIYHKNQNYTLNQRGIEGTKVLGFKIVTDIPLSGGSNRFDYQSINPQNNRLYVSHMDSNLVTVFDLNSQKVIADIKDISRPTGVLAVPDLDKVYISASGSNHVVVTDEQSLQITKRIPTEQFPDGIAYDPNTKKLFVSDESAKQVTVIDAQADKLIENINIGGNVGNTHYDSTSKMIYSADQSNNQLVEIDPNADKIAQKYNLTNCRGAHGFYIDIQTHYALITCEDLAQFVAFDLDTKKIIYNDTVGEGPDVLAFDQGLHQLYVAGEAGVISVFQIKKNKIRKLAENFIAPHAHTISVDQQTHRIYLPLENINDKAVLRILEPID